ncbi:MAG: zf-TFIIB domain-containing protein [Candidatus Competibacterales bacterium]|nr:zf-TFIIB domain-containing protein [Candidatus Competibacterales bacterium]
MKCPACSNQDLKIAERKGIEIDFCPQCRGVWLDRGELDKIIERTMTELSSAAPEHAYRDPGRRGHDPDHDMAHKRKKKSLLGELFDF